MTIHTRGFTLVELAIVLVIIGLISGGILAGSGMIRNAEVQSVASDFQEYEQAVRNFKDHYFALPGDYARATNQWGAVTEDGDDDGIINDPSIDEFLRAWQHLSLAGMIKGTYTGEISPAGHIKAGLNVPESKITMGGFVINQLGDQMLGGAPVGTSIAFIRAADTAITTVPVLTPKEAFLLDRKFDDGAPGTGIIKAPDTSGNYANCVTTDDPATAVYKGTLDTVECIISYQLRFDR